MDSLLPNRQCTEQVESCSMSGLVPFGCCNSIIMHEQSMCLLWMLDKLHVRLAVEAFFLVICLESTCMQTSFGG